MTEPQNLNISGSELEKPLPSGGEMEPLPLLPEREWLYGQIVDVAFQYVQFNGQIQYVKDSEGNEILDSDGNRIKRKQFKFTIELSGQELPNGQPRKGWVQLGASMSNQAHLPLFLNNIGINTENITPKEVLERAKNVHVKLQFSNYTKKNGETGQKVIWDSVKKSGPDNGDYMV